jgi:hypothetical protein
VGAIKRKGQIRITINGLALTPQYFLKPITPIIKTKIPTDTQMIRIHHKMGRIIKAPGDIDG